MDLYTLNAGHNAGGFWLGINDWLYMATSTITHYRPRCTHSGLDAYIGKGPAVHMYARVTI